MTASDDLDFDFGSIDGPSESALRGLRQYPLAALGIADRVSPLAAPVSVSVRLSSRRCRRSVAVAVEFDEYADSRREALVAAAVALIEELRGSPLP